MGQSTDYDMFHILHVLFCFMYESQISIFVLNMLHHSCFYVRVFSSIILEVSCHVDCVGPLSPPIGVLNSLHILEDSIYSFLSVALLVRKKHPFVQQTISTVYPITSYYWLPFPRSFYSSTDNYFLEDTQISSFVKSPKFFPTLYQFRCKTLLVRPLSYLSPVFSHPKVLLGRLSLSTKYPCLSS